MWDSIDADYRRHYPLQAIANWYAVSHAEIRLVAAAYRWARRNHRALPGRAKH